MAQLLSWLADDALHNAAQYLADRTEYLISNPRQSGNPITAAVQSQLIPELTDSRVRAHTWLREAMPFIHTQLMASVEGWSSRTSMADVMNRRRQDYIECRSTFSYEEGTAYIDRLAKVGQSLSNREFYITYVNGSYEFDVLPAQDHIKITYPDVENLKIIDLSKAYEMVTGEKDAVEQLSDALPDALSQVTPQAVPQIVIAYHSQSMSQMHAVRTAMHAQGIPTWTDEGLPPPGNDEWRDAVYDALAASAGVILLLSPQSKNSEGVRNIVNYARNRDLNIIPFWVAGDSADVSMSNVPASQRIDARGNENFDEALSQALELIERYIYDKTSQLVSE